MTAQSNKVQPTVYIIGAGLAGTMIAHEIKRKGVFGRVAAFLDDDPQKIGSKIEGIPVLGPIQDVARLIRVEARDELLIAIPSIKAERLREIYAIVKEAGFTIIKLLPGISQIVDGNAHLVQAREINPQDLLGRTPIKIGSELARQLLSGGAERLYLFGHGENSIYQIDKELRLLQEEGVGDKATIVPIVGELKDREYMHYIIGKLRCDAVFHTAAYKHVPLMEANPVAVIENNVFGTKNLLDACIENGVKRFVLISTDKAVNPVSIYGVSKMLNEKMVLDAAARVKEKYGSADYAYMFVRFGNVLGSRGSIFPLFVEQVKKGGPVTVTSPDMMRFFMTIPEACSLVLQTGGVGINGQSYLLDMGEPVNILETARQLIRYMGYEPEKDIPIEIIGVRPGERLEEPLTSETEYTEPTDYPKILRLQNREEYDRDTLGKLLAALHPVCCPSGASELYRNKEYLTRILCDACQSLRDAQ